MTEASNRLPRSVSAEIIPFRPRQAHRADRSSEICRSIFAAIHQGEGRDAHVVAKEFLAEWFDLTSAERNTAIALAYRVLATFDQLVGARVATGDDHDDGGHAA